MNSFFERRFVIQGIFIFIALVLLSRLFYIQVIDKSYFLSASNNVLRKKIIYPARGVILDRHGKILVQNEPVYDLMVIPNEVEDFDTLEFCRLIGIDKAGFDKRFLKAKTYSPYRASIFEKQISAITFASFQESLQEFKGFYVQNRSVRRYPDSLAGHFLGYIGEVNDAEIEKSGGFYRPSDYIGKTGVEKAYEELLRGQRGVENLMVDAFNRPKGHYADGKYDTLAVAGESLVSSLDLRIQQLGEKLMKNKVGSIVAIEPATGEILAFVSSPGYDPNLLVGRQRGKNMSGLYKNPYTPLLIRPIQAYYPPGSSFKPMDALVALQEGLIQPNTTFYCPGGYRAGNHWVRCEHVDGTTDLTKAIKMSCNTYFCYVFDRLMNRNGPKNIRYAFNDWRKHINSFGWGEKLNIDLPNEKRGLVPKDERYDKIFGKNRWRSSTIISLAIGQGELLATPLQLANAECIIANRGYYYTPHLIKSIGNKNIVKPEFKVKHQVGVDSRYFEPVIEGMHQVIESGTAIASRIPGISFCGKTGTVQTRGKNHSVFVGFAPRENPKIAIAVVVENAGYGASWAAPIASFVVEKYLRDSITRRPSGIDAKRYMNANLLPMLPGMKPQDKRSKLLDSLKFLQKDSIKNKQKIISLKKAIYLAYAKKDTVKKDVGGRAVAGKDSLKNKTPIRSLANPAASPVEGGKSRKDTSKVKSKVTTARPGPGK
ncbi:penicillin-binding protein 2 [Desertivirga brevis]|uniref:penicillin-binding protein 2 n=1 Tax=Desertivirga brevis TaxID=2810310 RepID=UPI001A977440|nr:penicillin-binding protein 2 [Pedobacter sp. SYSU D00873]